MATYSKSGSFVWAGGGKSGAIVDLWATSRFSNPPTENSAPPAGGADAGPVTTGTSFGSPGAYTITGIPTVQDYYVRVQYGGNTYWGICPAGTLTGVSSGGGGGAVTSVFTRTGDVVANTGDYTVSQITGAAPINNPSFTGVPTVPTAPPGTNTTQIADTAFVTAAVTASTTGVSQVTNVDGTLTISPTTGAVVASLSASEVAVIAAKAPLASPALTGTPTAPTATALTDNTQVATTAYADSAVGVEKTRALAAEALLAPLASPNLTGTPTAPTAAAAANNTTLATTAFVKNALLVPANFQTVNYAAQASDVNGVIEMNSTSALSVTLNSGIFAAGDILEVWQANTGTVNIVGGSGVTIQAPNGATALAGEFAAVTVRARSSSIFTLAGDLNNPVLLIQQISNYVATTGAVTATTTGSVSASDTLIVGIEAFGATSNTAGTITDTVSGTWVNLHVSSDALTTQHQWFMCTNPGAGVHAITWTPAAATTYGCQIMVTEWSGGAFTFDKASTAAYTSGTAGYTPSLTPGSAGELILVQGSADGTGSTMTTPTGGFTSLAPAAAHNPCAYYIGASSGAISCSWTVTPADTGTGSIAAFIP